jgi:uridine phosphorylase
MECAALFTAAAALRVRCGAVLNVIWNQERKAAGLPDPDDLDTSRGIRAAVEAIKLLAAEDENERKAD